MLDLEIVRCDVVDFDEMMIEYFYMDRELYVLIVDIEIIYFFKLKVDGLEKDIWFLYDVFCNNEDWVSEVSYKVY